MVEQTSCNYSVSPSQSGLIKDEENKLIYILGGQHFSRDIYRINVSSQSIKKLNISLPYPGMSAATTIFFKKSGRIYAFRGIKGGDSQRIAFTRIRMEIGQYRVHT